MPSCGWASGCVGNWDSRIECVTPHTITTRNSKDLHNKRPCSTRSIFPKVALSCFHEKVDTSRNSPSYEANNHQEYRDVPQEVVGSWQPRCWVVGKEIHGSRPHWSLWVGRDFQESPWINTERRYIVGKGLHFNYQRHLGTGILITSTIKCISPFRS